MDSEIRRRAKLVGEILDEMYPNPAVPLDHVDAYTLLVAVVLSAQCTDKRVNEVTQKLWEVVKSPADMVSLGEEAVLEIVRPCGLGPRKAASLVGLSRMIIEQYGGEVPSSREGLESLPGVGRKSASVVLSHIFKVAAFPVDTHIFRLAHRWGLSESKGVEGVEEDLCALYVSSNWEKLHLQMIWYGRTYCKARGHKLEDCVICQRLLGEDL